MTLAYQGNTCYLKDTRGLRAIAVLLHTPGQEQHVLDILAMASRASATPGGGCMAWPSLVPCRGLGATLDAAAQMAYKRRLLDLRTTLAEVQRRHDLATAQIQAEMDWLSSELAAAHGLGGRDRQVGADAERARSTVTKAIKAVAQDSPAPSAPASPGHPYQDRSVLSV